jgi:hypothetical protein
MDIDSIAIGLDFTKATAGVNGGAQPRPARVPAVWYAQQAVPGAWATEDAAGHYGNLSGRP